MKNLNLALIVLFALSLSVLAQRGKDGNLSVSSSTIINEYTNLTADATIGNTTINVTSSGLNSNARFLSGNLGQGDLILIIQMKGVSINGTLKASNSTALPKNDSWGEVTAYNNCGNYEFAEVKSIPNGTSIEITCGLTKDYTSSGIVQVIRVPRIDQLTINAGGSITADAWDGQIGGVVVAEVLHDATFNGGEINVDGIGFRGGKSSTVGSQFGTIEYGTTDPTWGSDKGESVFGYESDYDPVGGRYGMGAAANAGGGGCAHNAGGGGGGNGGDILNWNGKGNPSLATPSWASAWDLESVGFSISVSSGGGKGGYSFSSNDRDALTEGPDNNVWGGGNRRTSGGLGGRPLDYTLGKLFLAGAGGAGDGNDNLGGDGGNGGGLVYLKVYGGVDGAGTITAKGGNGEQSKTPGFSKADAAGGAGAGGTIVVDGVGVVDNITVIADGGVGGDQRVSPGNLHVQGPGGGGGGGYIAVSNNGGSLTLTYVGGTNGHTNSFSLSEFTPNGATEGGVGSSITSLPNFNIIASNIDTCMAGDFLLTASVIGTLPIGTNLTWFDSEYGNTVLGTGTTLNVLNINSDTIFYVGTCPGTYRVAVDINIDEVRADFSVADTCFGETSSFTDLSVSSAGTINKWDWTITPGAFSSTIQGPSYSAASAGVLSVKLIVEDDIGCVDSIVKPVTILALPVLDFSADLIQGCAPLPVAFTNNTSGGDTYFWAFGDGNTGSSKDETNTYTGTGFYDVQLIATSASGCTDSLTKTSMIDVLDIPTANFTHDAASNVLTEGDIVNFTNSSTGASSYNWTYLSTADTNTNITIQFDSVNSNLCVNLEASNGICEDTYLECFIVQAKPDTNDTTPPIIAVHIPNVLTPNGDDKNDEYVLAGFLNETVKLAIYNRWGRLVFNRDPYNNDWKGVDNNGVRLLDGTYYYVIESSLKDYEVLQGYITIVGND